MRLRGMLLRRTKRLLLPLMWLVFAVSTADAGAPTRTTITIDGSMSDWSTVLANPVNFQTDPEGSAPPSADADPQMDASQDLLGFAYTWDVDDLFVYVIRAAPDNAVHRFLLYVDLGNDGVMHDTDVVMVVRWSSSFAVVDVSPYLPVSPAGDAMVDGLGLADGYTLPGSVGGSTVSIGSNGNAANGRELEAAVPWGALGLAGPAGVQLHVSFLKSNNIPSAIVDNMGSTGGGPLSTAFEEVTLTPDRSSTEQSGTTVVYAHQLRCSGTDPARAELSPTWGCSGSPSVTLWEDQNVNGVVDPGIDVVLTDTNGNGLVDRALAQDESLTVLVQFVLPSGIAPGTACALTLDAWPWAQPANASTAVDTNTYPDIAVTLLKSVDRANAAPGEVLTYTTIYTNTGVDSAFVVMVTDAVPANTTYVAGSASGAGMQISFSTNNGVSWTPTEPAGVTDVRWSLLAPLPAGGAGSVSFQVQVE